jgi:plastocyanin
MKLSPRLSAALIVPLAAVALLLPACSGDPAQVATNGLAHTPHATAQPTATSSTTVKPGSTTPVTAKTTTTKVDVTVPPFGIVIENFKYADAVAKAHQVTKVVNKDSAPHTLTADDLSFDTKTIDAGATGEFTAPGPGTYKIHCVLHPFMTADLRVVS